MPALATGLLGFLIGLVVGVVVYRARLCTFGAIEDGLMGQDWRRAKVFGLALAVALLLTQGMILFDLLDASRTTYLPQSVPVVGLVIGGVLFGIGMALVGTCGFGSLIRLGSGDLRSLVVIIVYALFAYAMLRGLLSGFRIDLIEGWAWPMPGPSASDLATQMQRISVIDMRAVASLAIIVPLVLAVLQDTRLLRARRLLTAGFVLGLAVALGWAATGWWSDPFDLHQRVQSLTYVAPVARAMFGVLSGQDDWLDFGISNVAGVVIGAFAASIRAGEFRWEAFDDHHEMKRHLIGAICMGTGGVLAGGCTIGQGLTAGSLLALSMPIVILSMIVGARIGIAVLMGDAGDWMRRLASRA
ncbi:MAG: YeeE/YedE family protein [Beijerinckiaceae bacterium]|nr:YeeE/YedE family protein [Beijerinckiaceae bacterium]